MNKPKTARLKREKAEEAWKKASEALAEAETEEGTAWQKLDRLKNE